MWGSAGSRSRSVDSYLEEHKLQHGCGLACSCYGFVLCIKYSLGKKKGGKLKQSTRDIHSLVNFLFFLSFYLFLAVLGLHCCTRVLSSCSEYGPLSSGGVQASHSVASLTAEHRLSGHGLSSCGARAQLPWGMWGLLEPGMEPVFPALVGRFLTTGPQGKSLY